MKKIIPVFLSLLLAIANATSVFACTGVYVGNEVSENGSTYVGRSEDISDVYGKVFGVAPSREIAEGEVYEDTYGFELNYNNIDFDYPKTTYAYTYVRDSYKYGETMQDSNGNYVGQAYGAVGQNEKGLAMTSTVSTYYNNDAKAADHLLGTGLCEISILSVILAGASNAREAVELLASILDVYGAGECNSIMFSDPNESWYFEIVSGHQYAAIKLPKDKVSIQPNIMLLGVIDVNDTENVVTSENLVKLAQDNGFLETDANGNIHVAKTYAKETSAKSSRYWQGLYYVNKQLAANLDWETADMSVNPLDLLVDPDRKLTTLEVLRLLAYRGEGTAYDSNADSYTAIGNNRQTEVHVLETRPNMPTELSTIQWQGMADAEFTVYVPYYTALITETSEFYHTEEKPRDYISGGDTEGQINLNFHLINYLCYNNRANTAEAVKEYFEDYQQSLIDQQKAVDEVMTKVYAHGSEAAKVAATGVGKHLAKQISAMSSAVLAELRVYLASEQTEPFKLSEETLSLMPDYTIDEELLPTHTWTFDRDETTHWHKCEICGETDGKISHSWTTQFDETHHWEECECGATTLEKEHTFVNGECECGAKDANYVNPQPQEPEKDQPKGDSPSTSDSSSLMTYVVMMGFTVLGMVALTKKTKFN